MQKRLSLRVFRNRDRKFAESPQVGDLTLDRGNVIRGEKLQLAVVLFPLVCDFLELFVILCDLFFQLLPEILVVTELPLQFSREGVECPCNREC